MVNDPSYEKSEAYLKKVEEGNAQALAITIEHFNREHFTPEGKTKMGAQAITSLEPFLDHPLVSMASKELMRQSVVLAWIAFEALATDSLCIGAEFCSRPNYSSS